VHLFEGFVGDFFGRHPTTADTGENLGDALRLDFKDECVAGSDAVGEDLKLKRLGRPIGLIGNVVEIGIETGPT
jgi:hypothetical protein